MSAPPSPSSTIRAVFTAPAVARLALGWVAVAALSVGRGALTGPLATPVLSAVLAGIVAVVIACGIGIMRLKKAKGETAIEYEDDLADLGESQA